jgi:hypothetical protein
MVLQTLRTPAERKVYLFSHPRSALTVPKLLYKLLNKNGQRVKRSLDYKRSKKRETSGHCATLIHSRILHGDSSPIDPTRHFGHGARILHSSSSSQSMTEKLERIFVAWTRRKGDDWSANPTSPFSHTGCSTRQAQHSKISSNPYSQISGRPSWCMIRR